MIALVELAINEKLHLQGFLTQGTIHDFLVSAAGGAHDPPGDRIGKGCP